MLSNFPLKQLLLFPKRSTERFFFRYFTWVFSKSYRVTCISGFFLKKIGKKNTKLILYTWWVMTNLSVGKVFPLPPAPWWVHWARYPGFAVRLLRRCKELFQWQRLGRKWRRHLRSRQMSRDVHRLLCGASACSSFCQGHARCFPRPSGCWGWKSVVWFLLIFGLLYRRNL